MTIQVYQYIAGEKQISEHDKPAALRMTSLFDKRLVFANEWRVNNLNELNINNYSYT